LERVRAICDALPECLVEPSGGGGQHHKLTVRGKTLGWHTVDHHGDGRVALSLKAPRGDNAALVASDPVTFFLPPSVAHQGDVGVYLDIDGVDWDEVGELVVDADRLAAPQSLTKLVDAAEGVDQ
jgi:hypothetical protein